MSGELGLFERCLQWLTTGLQWIYPLSFLIVAWLILRQRCRLLVLAGHLKNASLCGLQDRRKVR